MNIETILEQIKGCTFAGLDALTPVKNLLGGKSNPQQGHIFKCNAGSNIMIGASYENMVKRRLDDQDVDPDTFKLSPRRWGTRIGDTPLIHHKGQVYLTSIFIASGDVMYFHNNSPIARDQIIGLQIHTQDPDQAGLERKVIVRDHNIRHITSLRLMGEEYTDLTHPLQE